MRFHAGGADKIGLADDPLEPEGCTRIGAHLMMNGAFNVNSTSIPAWEATLSGPGALISMSPTGRSRQPTRVLSHA